MNLLTDCVKKHHFVYVKPVDAEGNILLCHDQLRRDGDCIMDHDVRLLSSLFPVEDCHVLPEDFLRQCDVHFDDGTILDTVHADDGFEIPVIGASQCSCKFRAA